MHISPESSLMSLSSQHPSHLERWPLVSPPSCGLVLPVLELHINGFIQYVLSCVWLLSLLKSYCFGNSLAVQWLGLGDFTAEGVGSIPGWGTKIPQAAHGESKN